MIFTITRIQSIKVDTTKKPITIGDITLGDIHRVGYFTDLSKAINCVLNLDKENYQYAVIESIREGIYQKSKCLYVFEWQKGKYVSIKEPEIFKQLSNFSLG